MKYIIDTNLTLLWAFLCSLIPLIGISQSDCSTDNQSPFCLVKSFSINGIDSIGGAEVFFPDIAYDACSEIRVIDYFMVEEERKIKPGDFIPCGTHLMQTFVIDSSGNYSICEFTVEVKCTKRPAVKSSVKEKTTAEEVRIPTEEFVTSTEEVVTSIDYEIGSLSRKWESSNKGPGTISNAEGDPGGKSYGIYQISSKYGSLENFLNNEGLKYRSFFQGLPIASEEFDSAWKSVAQVYPNEFAQLQHDFIERTHYKVFIERIDPLIGFQVEEYSPVLKDVLWSTVVQHGPYSNILNYALAGINLDYLSEEAIIDLIYRERSKTENGKLIYFPSVGTSWKKGLLNRFKQERKKALNELRRFKD